MDLLDQMQPRDHSAAARTVSTLCAVAVAVTVGFAPIASHASSGRLPLVLATLTIVLVAGLSLLARYFHQANRWAWALCPLLAVAAIVVIDLLTVDASVSAQIFFLFPMLYGASQLRRVGAVVTTVASLVGEVLVVAANLSVAESVTDIGYVTAALTTAAVLLIRAGEHHDALVERLQQQAAVDPLTGLFTRRVLDEAATSALSGARNDDGTSLILVDVDDFKSINDRHGHPGGDQVLVELAGLLTERSQAGDVVCRMGGDEIAVLIPGCSAAAAHDRALDILESVRSGSFLVGDGTSTQVSVSIGLAHAPTQAATLRNLYSVADTALYQAKAGGRDRAVTLRS